MTGNLLGIEGGGKPAENHSDEGDGHRKPKSPNMAPKRTWQGLEEPLQQSERLLALLGFVDFTISSADKVLEVTPSLAF